MREQILAVMCPNSGLRSLVLYMLAQVLAVICPRLSLLVLYMFGQIFAVLLPTGRRKENRY